MANPLSVHKKGQGSKTRWGTFLLLSLFMGWGCYALYITLTERPFFWQSSAFVVADTKVYWGGIVAFGVFLVLALVAWRVCHGRRGAELLIETEQELKKVDWPTRPRVVNSSVVVILCMILFAGLLAGADALLEGLVRVMNLW